MSMVKEFKVSAGEVVEYKNLDRQYAVKTAKKIFAYIASGDIKKLPKALRPLVKKPILSTMPAVQ